VAAGLVTLAAVPVLGQALTVGNAVFIAPTSIPVDLAGDGPIPTGIARLAVAVNGNGQPYREIASLDITLNGDLVPTDLAEVYVTYESQTSVDRDGTYDADGTEVVLRTMTNEGGSGSFTGSGPYSLTMTLPDNEIRFFQGGNGYAILYVAVEFANGVDTSKALDIRVENIANGLYNAGGAPTVDDTIAGPFPAAGADIQLDDYEVTVTGDASFLGAGTLAPPGTTVDTLRLDFGVADATLATDGYVKVDSIRVHRIGTATDSDIATAGINIFADDDGTPGFSGGDTIYGTATMSGGYANVTLSTNDLNLSTGNLTYYVSADVSSGAVAGNTFGLEIETPATDIVFGDGITDIAGGDVWLIGQGFSGLITSFEYDQIGAIDPVTTSTPATTYTFEIDQGEDVTPPTVNLTSPDNGDVGVLRDAVITVSFSEPMTPVVASDITIVGSASGAIDPATDGTFTFNTATGQSFTFAKSTQYEYEEVVTVTVKNTVQDDAPIPNAMVSDYVFSFTIEPPTPPTVLGTVPGDSATEVAINTTVSIIFSEAMDEATILDAANFSLVQTGSTDEIAGTMTYSPAGFTAIFTPDEAFGYDTGYTATITTGMIDSEGTALEADYEWTFTTGSAAAGLTFTDIIVANNRITPGSSAPMRIFIEVPAGLAATDPVSVQVFTANGRRVATLTTSGETFGDVIARQPILWDGTNDRGQALGPGLYFVQISSGTYRRALRVMIVR